MSELPTGHFSRFGDGEWYAILGRKGTNIDGCSYEPPGLSQDLRVAAISPPPLVTNALQGLVRSKPELMREIRGVVPEVGTWPDADVFREAAKAGKHWELLERGRVCLVGPVHLGKLGTLQVVTPVRDAYHHRVTVMRKMWELRREVDTFLLSCGFLANVVIHHMSKPLGPYVSLLDVGAIWDPWCGVVSRPWQKKLQKKVLTRPQRTDTMGSVN